MKLLSWSKPTVSDPNIVSFAWANCDIGDPMALAHSIVAQLNVSATKTVFCFHALNGFLANVSAASLQNGVPPVERYVSFFEAFWSALKRGGVTPDFVVVDIEDWPSDWQWGGSATLLQQAARNKGAAIRRAIWWPMTSVYRKFIPCSNFTDCVPSTGTVLDFNGWAYSPVPKDINGYSVMGVSSPALYLFAQGNYYNQINHFAHDILWNTFTMNLNNAKACSGSTIVPWIDYPSYGNQKAFRNAPNTVKWMWQQQLNHLAGMNLEYCLLWNADGGADDQTISISLAEANKLPGNNGPWPLSHMDDDTITTGAVTTKYSDFLAVLASDGLSPSAKS
jgi:hypothetical protein